MRRTDFFAFWIAFGGFFVVTWMLRTPVEQGQAIANEGLIVAGPSSPTPPATTPVSGLPAESSVDVGSAKPNPEEQLFDRSALRNDVYDAAINGMRRRHASIEACLEGLKLSGDERIRFVADVDATASEAVIAGIRFDEIVDGERLPDSFPSCFNQAIGATFRIEARKGLPFPVYRGELAYLYKIPPSKPELDGE